MFLTGQKVVCINDDPFFFNQYHCHDQTLGGLKKGEIYTIRWVGIFDHPMEGSFLAIRVHGIVRESTLLGANIDWPYDARRFRPLVFEKKSTEAGMSILRGLLDKAPVLEDA